MNHNDSHPIVRLSNVHRIFKEDQVPVHAAVGINLEINKGEFVALMGASGSGKSTILNLIGLIERPDYGDIEIAGVNVSKLSEAKQTKFRLNNIGFIFQSLNLFEELNVYENVCLPLRLLGRYNKEWRNYARQLLVHLEMEERLLSKPNELSGGQQQRVAIARALVKSPSIMLADEPTANLDYANSIAVVQLLRQISQSMSQTIILVTHEQHLGALAERIIETRDGQIISDRKN